MKKLSISSFCVLVLLIGLSPQMAHAAKNTKQKLITYDEGKAIVIKNGYLPMVLKHDKKSLLCYGDDICQRRPEIFFCSGMGADFCDFAFERPRDHRRIVIETYGESSLMVHELRAANKVDEEFIKEHQ